MPHWDLQGEDGVDPRVWVVTARGRLVMDQRVLVLEDAEQP